MANIIGYSSGFLKNPAANQIGVPVSGVAGAPLVPVYEPKFAFPEKQGDTPLQRMTCTFPLTKMDGTPIVIGDQFIVAPLPAGVRVTALTLNILAGGTGTYGFSCGNLTSPTAYLAATSVSAASAPVATQLNLDLAAAGTGPNDAVILTVTSATTPGGTPFATATISYGVPNAG